MVTGVYGQRWRGAKEVVINYNNPKRIVKIYK